MNLELPDLADLLETNIDLYQKNLNLIISYVNDQKNNSSYADNLSIIGDNAIKKYLYDNPDYMKNILNEILLRKNLIKIYKQKLKKYNYDPIKTRILKFGLKLIKYNLYNFKRAC